MVGTEILPPPPVREPITDKTGKISNIWWTWFTQLYNRNGGAAADTNADLSVLQAYNNIPVAPPSNVATATSLKNSRLIYGNSFNGTANVTGIIAPIFGGTANGFTKFSGPATTEKTYTLPNASATILTDNSAVPFSNIAQVTANTVLANPTASTADISTVALTASQLLGRGSTGNIAAITLGTNLSMSGATLNASGSSISANASAYDASGTTLATNAYTKINYDTERWDTGGYYDTTTKRYTPLVAGTYLVSASTYIAASAVNTTFALALFKNGSSYKQSSVTTSAVTGAQGLSISCSVQLNGSTDYIEIFGFNGNAISTFATSSGTLNTYFDISWVGP